MLDLNLWIGLELKYKKSVIKRISEKLTSLYLLYRNETKKVKYDHNKAAPGTYHNSIYKAFLMSKFTVYFRRNIT